MLTELPPKNEMWKNNTPCYTLESTACKVLCVPLLRNESSIRFAASQITAASSMPGLYKSLFAFVVRRL